MDGHGTMAQFNHPEFGGAGQWMQGGMTMVSDMFNQQLKMQVEGLCAALSQLLASSGVQLTQPTSFQSQHQGGQPSSPSQHTSGPVSLFVASESGGTGRWWPNDLGVPSSTGAQNQVRYAYFSEVGRLAIEVNGHITVYDTLDHHISGFSQQQSGGSSLSFSSQHGLVDVAQLPVIAPDTMNSESDSQSRPATEAPSVSLSSASEQDGGAEVPVTPTASVQPAVQGMDIFTAIEKLGELNARDLLTDEEFTNKKADLLNRL
ncbi:hypothetical protein C2W62_33580 [Candidatus Entotheonella serta]|nr:hypothetical protein C2W62_33580 [Candidatus Entotheonella serta]